MFAQIALVALSAPLACASVLRVRYLAATAAVFPGWALTFTLSPSSPPITQQQQQAPPPLRLDPADSWLVYAKAAGNGKRVLSVNASWVVPAYPTTRGGGNAPGWWFGIEPNPAE